MKPLLPRTDSYLLPIQLPVASSFFLPSSFSQLPPSSSTTSFNSSSQKQSAPREAKRVRIAPKVRLEENSPSGLLQNTKKMAAVQPFL